VETAQLADATPVSHSRLQTPAFRFAYVAQETKRIQEVGFAGCIGAEEVRKFAQRYIQSAEVSPIFEL